MTNGKNLHQQILWDQYPRVTARMSSKMFKKEVINKKIIKISKNLKDLKDFQAGLSSTGTFKICRSSLILLKIFLLKQYSFAASHKSRSRSKRDFESGGHSVAPSWFVTDLSWKWFRAQNCLLYEIFKEFSINQPVKCWKRADIWVIFQVLFNLCFFFMR